MASVMHVLSGSEERDEKSRGYSAVILRYRVNLVHGSAGSCSHRRGGCFCHSCQPLHICKGLSISEFKELSGHEGADAPQKKWQVTFFPDERPVCLSQGF